MDAFPFSKGLVIMAANVITSFQNVVHYPISLPSRAISLPLSIGYDVVPFQVPCCMYVELTWMNSQIVTKTKSVSSSVILNHELDVDRKIFSEDQAQENLTTHLNT